MRKPFMFTCFNYLLQQFYKFEGIFFKLLRFSLTQDFRTESTVLVHTKILDSNPDTTRHNTRDNLSTVQCWGSVTFWCGS
jgi:hypothetical protein